MKKRIIAAMVMLSGAFNNVFVAYSSNTEAKSGDLTTKSMDFDKQYAEKESEVLKMYLADKRYVYPSQGEFKKRCSEFWGIDVDTIPYGRNLKGEDQLFTESMIFRHGPESVYYYPSYEAHLGGKTKGDAKEAYDAMKYADDSLDYYYNQLLFHDDVRALSKFLKYSDLGFNVVFYHNYERNKLLFEKATAQYLRPESRDWESLKYALFYNNIERGVRKDFIKHIAHFKNEKPENYTLMRQTPVFCGFVEMFIDVFDYIDIPVELKDECLCYMILLLYDFCEDFNKKYSCGEAVGAEECVASMVGINGYNFIERIENKNFYGNSKLKEIIKYGMLHNLPFYDPKKDGIVDRGSAILYGRVVDKDGYVNLRASDDPKSNIIGRISSGEDVRFVDMTQDEIEIAKMLKVRTKDGRIGYVHSSRLRLYLMCTDKRRKSILDEYQLPYIKKYEW